MSPLDHLFSRSFHQNKRSKGEVESLIQGDVLGVSGKKNKVMVMDGMYGVGKSTDMGKSTLAIMICKSWANGGLLTLMQFN